MITLKKLNFNNRKIFREFLNVSLITPAFIDPLNFEKYIYLR